MNYAVLLHKICPSDSSHCVIYFERIQYKIMVNLVYFLFELIYNDIITVTVCKEHPE
jgi:hypothetical protein